MKEFLIELELDPEKNYTPKEIKKQWMKLAQIHHPDKGGSEEKFKKVTHAYMMLTDPAYKFQEDLKSSSTSKRELDIRFTMPITFEEAFFGVRFNINYGFAKINSIGNRISEKATDPLSVDTVPMVTVTLPVNIPMGSFFGGEMGFKGKGMVKITDNGEECGDALIMVQVLPHAKFRWDEQRNAITSNEQIPLDIMLKGGTYEVLTMMGMKTLKIRPGTPPDSKIGIKGAGFGGGDHIVTVSFKYPSKEELKSDAWKDFGIKWDEEEAMANNDSEVERLLQSFIRIKGDIHRSGIF